MAPPIIKRFLISFEQNWWLGLLTLLACLGGSGIILSTMSEKAPPRPLYTARGALSFQSPPPAFTSTGSQLQQQGRSVSKPMLLSERVLRGVMSKLRLTPEEIVKIRDKDLTITFPNEDQKGGEEVTAPGQLITLEYIDPESPTRATLILETFMGEMVDYSRWINTAQWRNRIEALSKRLSQVQKDLTASEEAFYRYITQQGSDLLAIQDGSLFSSITNSQQQQRDLKLALQQIEGQMKSLIAQLDLTPEQAKTAVALSADPILAGLRAQISQNEQQIQRLEQNLRPEHPTMVKLLKEQQVNETLLMQRAAELIGARELVPVSSEVRKGSNLDPTRLQLAAQLLGLQTQREGLLKQLQSVVKTEQELRQQYEKFPDRQLQQARLVQKVEFNRIVYQNILTALVDAQAAEAETGGSLAIAQEPSYQPTPPPSIQKTNPVLVLGAGAGIGVVAGAAVIFLLALLDDRLHASQELRDALTEREVPVLGQLPYIPSVFHGEEVNPALLDADSVYLPFYERVRSNLRRLRPEVSSKVILITSVANEEGKSVTAYNLAIASAQAGKRTLLVEADLRSPSKARWLEVNPAPEASIEPLRYYAARSEAIELVPAVANLYVLPSPGPQRQAAAIVESSELQMVLKDARGRFDMVIVDTPSLSRCNDALLLEPLTDGVVLVTHPGITRSSLLAEAIAQFAEAEIPILGAVINGVEDLAIPAPLSLAPFESESEPSEEGTDAEAESQMRV